MRREEIKKNLLKVANIYHGLFSSPSIENEDYYNFAKEYYDKFLEEETNNFITKEEELVVNSFNAEYIHNTDSRIIHVCERSGEYFKFEGKYDIKKYDDDMRHNEDIQRLIKKGQLAFLDEEGKDKLLLEFREKMEKEGKKRKENPLIMEKNVDQVCDDKDMFAIPINLDQDVSCPFEGEEGSSYPSRMTELMELMDEQDRASVDKMKGEEGKEIIRKEVLSKAKAKGYIKGSKPWMGQPDQLWIDNPKKWLDEKEKQFLADKIDFIFDKLKLSKYDSYGTMSPQKKSWITIKAKEEGLDPKMVHISVKEKINSN